MQSRSLDVLSIALVILGGILLIAAVPSSGTLTAPSGGQSSSIAWTRGPYTGATADPSLCTTLTCDSFAITVDVPSTFYSTHPGDAVHVKITWSSSTNDFDLYVHDASGAVVCSSAQGGTTFEDADCGQLASGTYTAQIVAFTTGAATYNGAATLGPEPTTQTARARYTSGTFTFSAPLTLPGPADLLFTQSGVEPRAAVDALGTIYVATIQGVPAGTDASVDGGTTWTVNPLSTDVWGDDRRWIASHGDRELYLTYKQLGVLLAGTPSIFLAKSFDGGLTFPQLVEVTTPALGVQPGLQGNLVVDQRNGTVYNVFVGAQENQLYLVRSTDGGQTVALKLIFHAPTGVSIANVFPALAVDAAGYLHVVFSDGHNVYLCSSSDGGATWTLPARVNNGAGTKTAISPWIEAGQAGKVNVVWWGTSAATALDSSADWHVFFAQTQDAFANVIAFAGKAATPVMHSGPICVEGLSCPNGTRSLAEYFALGSSRDGSALIPYPDDKNNASPMTTFVRQTGGSLIGSR